MATMTSSQFWDYLKAGASMHIAAVTEKSDPETESELVETALSELEARYR